MSAAAIENSRASAGVRRIPATVVLSYAALVALGALFLMPFLWALSASFKTNADIYRFPPTLIPHPFHPENYAVALSVLPFWRFALNSALISLACVAGQL